MKKKLILKILDELDKNNKIISKEEIEVDDEQYGQIFDIMLEAKLISGIDVKRIGIEEKYSISKNHPKITLKGIEYLEKNTRNCNNIVEIISNRPGEMVIDKNSLNINRTY